MMSQSGVPFSADMDSTPPQAFAIPLTTNIYDRESDDSKEWEYEYSETDTEVGIYFRFYTRQTKLTAS
jgi:hypothetical protein